MSQNMTPELQQLLDTAIQAQRHFHEIGMPTAPLILFQPKKGEEFEVIALDPNDIEVISKAFRIQMLAAGREAIAVITFETWVGKGSLPEDFENRPANIEHWHDKESAICYIVNQVGCRGQAIIQTITEEGLGDPIPLQEYLGAGDSLEPEGEDKMFLYDFRHQTLGWN